MPVVVWAIGSRVLWAVAVERFSVVDGHEEPLLESDGDQDGAQRGRAVKLHPAGQRFFPDAPEATPVYQECARLGLPVLFHGGRAGIEPSYTHQFTLISHYEGALRRFPEVQFLLGHAGARDVADAVPLAQRHPNLWFGIHGQGVTTLHELIERVGSDRLLFGSDWPFYHLAATLAKVLLVTEGRPDVRGAILRDNAVRLLEAGHRKY